jgi:hypothetical protein
MSPSIFLIIAAYNEGEVIGNVIEDLKRNEKMLALYYNSLYEYLGL